jgi:surface protein
MFYNCSGLTSLDIKHFDVTSVTDGTNFLSGSNNALTTTAYNELLEAWAAQDVQPNVAWHFGDAKYTVETIADWYSPRSGSSLSIINNKLVSIVDSTATFGAAQQVDNLIIGNSYKIVGKATCSNSSATVYIRVGTTYNVNDLPFNITGTGSVTANATFIATATTHYVGTIVTGHAANDTVTIDAGITVKEVTNYATANAASEIEYSQENVFGSEEVVNGDFADGDSNWIYNSSIFIVNTSGAKHIANAGAGVLKQNKTRNSGTAYLVSVEVFDYVTGSCQLQFGGVGSDVIGSITANGLYEFITTLTAERTSFELVGGGGATEWTARNVSVKEITNAVKYKNIPQSARELYTLEDDTWVGSNELVVNGDFATDSDWSLGTGWTISNGKINSSGSAANSFSQDNIFEQGKTYIISFEILTLTQGSLRLYYNGPLTGFYTANSVGVHTVTVKVLGTNPRFYIFNNAETTLFIGSMDNVSVKEVIEVAS